MYENENYVDHTQNYSTYQTTYGAEPVNNGNKKKKEKKTGGIGKRIGALVLSGVLFGVVAGISFCGVNYVWDLKFEKEQTINVEDGEPGDAANVTTPELGVSGSGNIKVSNTQNNVSAQTSDDITGMVEEVMPAMVIIVNNSVETSSGFFGHSYSQEVASSGSGIIVAESDTELLIVTNNHVVEDTIRLEVTFVDGTTAEAQIKGLNAKMDLAVISIPMDELSEETKAAITIATIGDSDELKLGEPVIAIGNALGYGQSVTRGIVSALDREITGDDGITGTFIQTDTAINPGNSGGALLNMKGEVIGINSSKIGGTVIEGMGYAIPINEASPIISDLITRETRNKVSEEDRGYMGIRMQAVTSSMSQAYNCPMGVYIVNVEPGTPAAEAGMMMADIIVGFDGLSITDAADLEDTLLYYAAGETVEIEVMRLQNGSYESVMLNITLGKRPN